MSNKKKPNELWQNEHVHASIESVTMEESQTYISHPNTGM